MPDPNLTTVPCCVSPNIVKRLRKFVNGSLHIAPQCSNCGARGGNWLPHEPGWEHLPPFDMDHYERRQGLGRDERRRERNRARGVV